MKRVCVVGVGLIGGSLGLALRRVRKNGRRSYDVVGLGRSARSLTKARKRGALDRFSTNPADVIPTADIVVLCVPVQSIVPTAKKILPYLKIGAIVSDVGSVKQSLTKEMKRLLHRRRNHFIGAHPLAGSEKFGIENARADMFANTKCVLISDGAAFQALSEIKKMWQSVGATSLLLSAKRHDQILSLTSHLPHLIAFALFSSVQAASKKDRMVQTLVAGSFRDMTRIAGSEPTMWADIMTMNRTELKKAGAMYLKSLKKLLHLSGGTLRKTISSLSQSKRHW